MTVIDQRKDIVEMKGLLEFLQDNGIETIEDAKKALAPKMFVVIPLSILERKDLKPNSKILYGEILALTQKDGRCTATDKYLSERLGVSSRSIQRLIDELCNKELITRETTKSNGGTYRTITINTKQFVNDRNISTHTDRNVRGGMTLQRDGSRRTARRGNAKQRDQNRNREIEIEKRNKDKDTNVSLQAEPEQKEFGNAEINTLMKIWEPLNPTMPNKQTQRNSCYRLIKKLGFEKVKAAMEYAFSIQGQEYAPVITTPYDFEKKAGKVAAHRMKEMNDNESKVIKI